MLISIELQATTCKLDPKIVSNILDYLIEKGLRPLIFEAKNKFTDVFGISQADTAPSERGDYERYLLFQASRLIRDREGLRLPVAGDLFFSREGNGILYLALIATEREEVRRRAKEEPSEGRLEVGFVGADLDRDELSSFTTMVSDSLRKQGLEPSWSAVETANKQFLDLCRSEDVKFVLASSLPAEELSTSATLENELTRNIAIVVRRSGGGMLASDLLKKGGENPEEIQRIAERLREAGLLSREYVVICRRTSNQVNRVPTRDKIDMMAGIGVMCSCGNLISDERIEEVFVPSPMLQRMLDQSFWMTARLVHFLRNLGIPFERILLNLQEGAEEIDSFVDLDGTLLMFELKDSEFSMGHAYPFSGRIGLYKPTFAFIVSTKGVAPEVRDYFKRVKPETEIVYIENLHELELHLQRVIAQVRLKKAQDLLSLFEPMANVQVPLGRVLAAKLGVEKQATRQK